MRGFSRILVTNDDGIDSPGLHALARAVAGLGVDVLVVAPRADQSGSSAAIGHVRADEAIEVTPAELPGAPHVRAFSVPGPPSLAVMLARLGAFGAPPDLVVSGINAGLNTGHSTLHSGTVGAVLTAQNFGACGLAVSIDARQPWRWETACDLALSVLALLAGAPPRTVLNLNVPGLPHREVRGVRWAKLDQFGSVRAAVAEPSPLKVQIEFRATGAPLDPDSDTALVAQGYATLTALVGISAVAFAETRRPLPEVTRSIEVAPTQPGGPA
jgi:5'/3'-nucleotidase